MKKVNFSLILTIIIAVITYFVGIYSISISRVAASRNAVIGVYIALAVLLIGIIVGIIKIFEKKEIKPEKALIILMPIFCIIILITIPVGRGHDEVAHWTKAFEISQGQLIPKIDKKLKVAETNLPIGVEDIVVERSKGVFKYVDNIQLLDAKIDYSQTEKSYNQNSAAYCFVQYIPEVAGVLVGKLITQNPLLIAYITRFINMLICTAIMYIAIKLIPFGKNLLLAIALIPISIEGFATISPDGFTIAICLLFIAYVLNVAFNDKKQCGKKEVAILTVLGAIVSLCKIVYMPLVFLSLIIPKEKFADKKERIISNTIIVSVGVILNLIWLLFGSSILLSTNTNTYLGTDENGTMIKITALLSNPLAYGEKLFYTIGLKFNQYFLSLFGGQLEWSEVIRIEIVPYVICAVILLVTLSEEKLKTVFKKYQKIIIILIISVITVLIFTSLFIQWSDNELPYIDGVQGRYFLQILPLILFIIGGLKIKVNYSQTQITKLICITSLIVMLYTAFAIIAEHL